jgi:NADH:ubiquinone oxidoreductase subunit 6 (subunit J)
MVQIAVYAGAIMVLFLFVIMLLGAEKLPAGETTREFRWMGPIGLGLASAFLIAAAWGLSEGRIDAQTPPPGQALVRFVNAAPQAAQQPAADANALQIDIAQRHFDVYIGEQLVAAEVASGEISEYAAVDPGELNVIFSPRGTQIPLVTAPITVEPDAVMTVVLHGEADAELALTPVANSVAPTDRGTGRVVIFNAYPGFEAVSVVDVESELFDDSRQVNPVISDLAYGTASDALDYTSGRPNWQVIEAGREEGVLAGETRYTLLRLNDAVQVEESTAHLLIVTGERAFDGGDNPLRAAVIDATVEARDSFGSPQAMGRELFTAYALPLQLVAVLLLAAMIGVIVLTVREEHTPKPSRALRRKVSRPLTSVIASQTGSDLNLPAPRLPAPEREAEPEAPAEQTPEPAGD